MYECESEISVVESALLYVVLASTSIVSWILGTCFVPGSLKFNLWTDVFHK